MFVYLEKDTENGCKKEICDINEQSQEGLTLSLFCFWLTSLVESSQHDTDLCWSMGLYPFKVLSHDWFRKLCKI